MSYTPPTSGNCILTFEGAYTAPTSGNTIMTLGGSAGVDTVTLQASLPSFEMTAQSGSYIVGTMPAMTMTSELFCHFMVGQIPALFLTVQVGYAFGYDAFDLKMPALEASLYGGGRITSSLPKMTLSCVAVPGRVGSLVCALPSLSGVFYSGAVQSMVLPRLSASMAGIANNLADISGQIPFLVFNGSVNNIGMGSIVAALPMMNATVHLLTGEVGNLVGRLPPMDMQMTGLYGGTGELEGSLPLLKLRVTSIITGDNDMVMTLEPLSMSIQSGTIEDDVLRYVRRRIR